jgi:beta-glucan synthesis-associated protein KRE6
VGYVYDPAVDEPPDEVDLLHDPSDKDDDSTRLLTKRGIMNVGALLLLIGGLLCLFIFYPVWYALRTRARNAAIDGNARINGTGQNPAL